MLLVGYEGESSNYRVYDPVTKKVKVSRDVSFNEEIGTTTLPENNDEDDLLMLPMVDQEDYPHLEEKNDVDEEDEAEEFQLARENEQEPAVIQAEPQETERNLRDRTRIKRPARYETNVAEYAVPLSYQEAVKGPNAEQWIEAINSELEAHNENQTWVLVERKTGMKTIDSKWVFKVMKDADGNIYRHKARLCARGFMQQHGVDYLETFSPVVRYDSLRVLLAVVAAQDLELAQFDVQTAFLHGKLEEEIHMELPEGFKKEESSGSTRRVVCRLDKSIYGLKQSPRCWNKKFSAFLKKFNFRETEADKCIFVGNVGESVVYLTLFVDDG